MSGEGLMALFKSVVLLNEVEVIASDDDGPLHLVGNNNTPIFAIITELGRFLLINIVFWELSFELTRWNLGARLALL
jgi:hypothetical protein